MIVFCENKKEMKKLVNEFGLKIKSTQNVYSVYYWDDIIKYVKENNITLLIVDIDGVLLSERNHEKLTEEGLAEKINELQDHGVTIICLTARRKRSSQGHNNHKKTIEQLSKLGIDTHGIRMTDSQRKGKFIQHILKEHPDDKAIFIDDSVEQVQSSIGNNNNLYATFLYCGDWD